MVKSVAEQMRESLEKELREGHRAMLLFAIFFAALGLVVWPGLWVLSAVCFLLWLLCFIRAFDDWSPRRRKPPSQESVDSLTDRIRVDRRQARERDMRAWDKEFYGPRRLGVGYPSAKAVHRPAMDEEEQ